MDAGTFNDDHDLGETLTEKLIEYLKTDVTHLKIQNEFLKKAARRQIYIAVMVTIASCCTCFAMYIKLIAP